MRRIVFLVVAADALTLTCRLLAGVDRREDLLSMTSLPRLEKSSLSSAVAQLVLVR